MKKLLIFSTIFLYLNTYVFADEAKAPMPGPVTSADMQARLDKANIILTPNGRRPDSSVTIETAKSLLDQNLADDINHGPTYLALSAYYLYKKNLVQAIISVDRAIAMKPNYHEALFTKALFFYIQGNKEDARLIKTRGLEVPKEELTYDAAMGLSQLLMIFKEPDTALIYLQLSLTKATKDLDKSQANSVLGDFYISKKDFKKCVEYKEKAVFFDLENSAGHVALASCYIQNKQSELAMMSAQRALAIVESDAAKVILMIASGIRAEELLAIKNYSLAETVLKNVLKIYDKDPGIYIELMKCQLKQENQTDAVISAQNAIMKSEFINQTVMRISDAFKDSPDGYSPFMLKVSEGLTSRSQIAMTNYKVGSLLVEMNKKSEAEVWVKKGLTHLLTKKEGREPTSSETARNYYYRSKFEMLRVQMDHNNLTALEEANKHFKTAKNLDAEDKDLMSWETYLNKINKLNGRNPSSVVWKAKLYLSKYITVSLPRWLTMYF